MNRMFEILLWPLKSGPNAIVFTMVFWMIVILLIGGVNACESRAVMGCGLSVNREAEARDYCHVRLDRLFDVARGATNEAKQLAWERCLWNYWRQVR